MTLLTHADVRADLLEQLRQTLTDWQNKDWPELLEWLGQPTSSGPMDGLWDNDGNTRGLTELLENTEAEANEAQRVATLSALVDPPPAVAEYNDAERHVPTFNPGSLELETEGWWTGYNQAVGEWMYVRSVDRPEDLNDPSLHWFTEEEYGAEVPFDHRRLTQVPGGSWMGYNRAVGEWMYLRSVDRPEDPNDPSLHWLTQAEFYAEQPFNEASLESAYGQEGWWMAFNRATGEWVYLRADARPNPNDLSVHWISFDEFLAATGGPSVQVGTPQSNPVAETRQHGLPTQKPEYSTLPPADTAIREGESSCSICTESFVGGEETTRTACGHDYHWGCIAQWTWDSGRSAPVCPLCRRGMWPVRKLTVEAPVDS